ncbi:MAG: flagellar motor switch protein FliN [Sphingorhabdus sp.]
MSDMSAAPKPDLLAKPTFPIDLLAGISVRMSVEVGSTRMYLADVAALEPGSVIALDRKAGEPLDICANGSPVARGEIVATDGHYGIRITELLVSTANAASGSGLS